MKICGALIALTVAFATGPALAGETNKADVEVRRVMHDYSVCVIKAQHRSASTAILADVDNGGILRRFPELISSDCMGRVAGSVEMRFVGDFYRYALADALVNADLTSAGPTTFADRLPLAHLPMPSQTELEEKLAKTKSKRKRDELKETFAKENNIVRLSHYGECVVRADPEGARYWLLTKPDVAEEMSRIDALRPAFAGCLDAGTVRFPRATMRGTVAINYYRLAMATPQRPIGKLN